jgi:hypothetical protein
MALLLITLLHAAQLFVVLTSHDRRVSEPTESVVLTFNPLLVGRVHKFSFLIQFTLGRHRIDQIKYLIRRIY